MTTSHVELGGCLCGAVRYRFSGEPTVNDLCHCRSCRLAAGAPSVAWTVVRAADFAFTRGSPTTYESSPGVERSFCGICGTSLTYRSSTRPEVIDVTTASLDDPDRYAPKFEIWLDEKIAWEAVDASRPRYPRSSKTSQPLP